MIVFVELEFELQDPAQRLAPLVSKPMEVGSTVAHAGGSELGAKTDRVRCLMQHRARCLICLRLSMLPKESNVICYVITLSKLSNRNYENLLDMKT